MWCSGVGVGVGWDAVGWDGVGWSGVRRDLAWYSQ